MRRCVFFILALVFICGCEQPKQTQKTKKKSTIHAQKSYLADAIQHLKEADPNAAIRSFDEAIKQDPLNPESYLLLGQVYMHMRDYPRAIDTFAASVRVAPDEGDGYYYLAMCHGLMGNIEFAVSNAQKSIEVFRRIQDEEKFMRALALLQGLMQTQEPPEAE